MNHDDECACADCSTEDAVHEARQSERLAREAETCTGCGRPKLAWLCRCGGPC